jgi:glycosyltransferase involved in cell wall biosynthesis
MHITYLTPEYPHDRIGGSGGMGTSIKNLVNELVKNKVKVSVFVYGQKSADHFEENGINFYLLKQIQYSFGGFYLYRKYINQFVNKAIEKEGIDLLEVPDWTGITAFMKFKIPVVMRFHGSDTYFCHLEGRKQKWKNLFFEKLAVSNAVGYIAPTHFAGNESAKLFNLNPSTIEVIPYGLVLAHFENPNPQEYKPYTLLNIGTLIRKKGVFELIDIFNQLIELESRATLTFIGGDSNDIQTGSSSTWVLMQERMSEKVKAHIYYKGKIPYDQVRQEILEAHVCVFPSLAETLGMVTIESMALQKTVLNTNLGWSLDLIDDDLNGFLIDPLNTAEYVSKIVGLFNQPKKVNEVGRAARQKIEQNFDIKKIAPDNLEYYRKVLKSTQ